MSIRYRQIRCTIAVTVLVLSGQFTSHGQHTAALKAHTFRTFGGLYTIGYEQAINKHVTAELSLQGGNYIDFRPNRQEDYQVNGIGVIGALRYYPITKKAIAPRGFFTYAALRYINFKETFLYTASGQYYEL